MYTDSDRFRDIASAFIEAGYITAPGRVIKLGKEASVLCCPAHPSLGVENVALKVYKDQSFRNFRNDAVYLRGKVWKRRDLAHLHAFKDQLWVDTEFRVLERLYDAGVRVPRPYTQIGHALLMEHVTADGDDAPMLKHARLTRDDAARVLDEVIDAIDRMLACGIVHGDLSVFNILYDGEHPVIIDFPQAVFANTHDDPYPLFLRDVERVVESLAPVPTDAAPAVRAAEVARNLWERHYLIDASVLG